jgi:hypothetical protein
LRGRVREFCARKLGWTAEQVLFAKAVFPFLPFLSLL